MKQWFARLGAAAVLLLASMTIFGLPARAQDGDLDFQRVYEELDRSGHWYEHPRYGRVWAPDVGSGWRPYTRGQWVNTEDYGWYWESEEPFGWAVFHYGRWFLDDRQGWSWVPGNEWGPAWVAWRTNDDDIGWAALPPEAEWSGGTLSLADSYYDSPRFSPAWCFVPVALLVAPRIWSHIAPSGRNSYFLGRTRVEPFQRGHQAHFFNRGIDPRRWEQRTGYRVDTRPAVTVNRSRDAAPSRGGAVQIYRPRVVATPPAVNAPRGGVAPPFERRGNPRTWPSTEQHQQQPSVQPQHQAQPQLQPRAVQPQVQPPRAPAAGAPPSQPHVQPSRGPAPAVQQPQAVQRAPQAAPQGGQRPQGQPQGQVQGQGQHKRPDGQPPQGQPPR